MGLTFSGKTPSAITIGGKQVDNIVMNGEVVWPELDPTDYFYVQNQYNGSNTITIRKNGSPSTGADIQVSLDKITWYTISDYGSSCTISLSVLNKKVYFRSSTGFSEDTSNYYTINGSRNFSIGGKLGTIIDYTNNLNTVPAYCFYHCFDLSSTLVDVSNLNFSGLTILGNGACAAMFNQCNNLINVPNLYFTSMGDNSCASMFRKCTSLTSASSITIAGVGTGFSGCANMFEGCTLLTTTPTLSATNLASSCYFDMFKDCTSLTTSPTLPATTLVSSCYNRMFYGCTNLNKIIVRATSWDTSDASDWVRSVSSTGDFYNLGGANIPTGWAGIPSNWTVHTSL